MTKAELIDRLDALKVKLQNSTIGDADYEILENWYIALDFDKDIFAKIVSVVGVETLIGRHAHATAMVTAMDEYQKREQYERNRRRLAEIESERERLAKSVQAYENANHIRVALPQAGQAAGQGGARQ
jgi:hypothetical protein